MSASKLGKANKNLDALGQTYYNSLVAMPCLLALVKSTEEPIAISANPFTNSFSFIMVLTVCCLIANANNFLLLACSTYVSPMATSVSGQIKDFALLLCGFLLFNDAQANFWFVTGLTISMLSAVYYALAKTRSVQPKEVPLYSHKISV